MGQIASLEDLPGSKIWSMRRVSEKALFKMGRAHILERPFRGVSARQEHAS